MSQSLALGVRIRFIDCCAECYYRHLQSFGIVIVRWRLHTLGVTSFFGRPPSLLYAWLLGVRVIAGDRVGLRSTHAIDYAEFTPNAEGSR